MSPSLLFLSNLSIKHFLFWSVIFYFQAIRILSFSPPALPGACRSTCKGFDYFSYTYVMFNDSLDVFHLINCLCSFSFLFHFLFKDGYPLHTPTLTNAGTHPLRIPWVTIPLCPSVTLKIWSIKPSMRMTKVVKYPGN